MSFEYYFPFLLNEFQFKKQKKTKLNTILCESRKPRIQFVMLDDWLFASDTREND